MDGKPLERRTITMALRAGPLGVRGPRFRVAVRNETIDDAIAARAQPLPDALEDVDGLQSKGRWMPDPRIGLEIADGWVRYVYKTYPRYYIQLEGGYEAYKKRFSSKALYNLRRQRRIYFEKTGVPEGLFVAREPAAVEEFARRALAVSKTTYQETVFHAGLPSTPEFRRTMEAAAAEGRMRGYVLAGPEGRDAAYMYCVIEDGNVLCKYIGYDPADSRYSPGSTLLFMAIEGLLAEEGLRHFDFGEGDAQYKKQFSTGSVPCADMLLLRRSVGRIAWLSMHRALGSAVARLSQHVHSFKARRLAARQKPGASPEGSRAAPEP